MPLKILLVHPQNYLHSYKTGIYRKVGGYLPLTMPLLASLIPKDILAEVRIVNEIAEEFDARVDTNLVAITAIAGTSIRAYSIADAYRARGIPVVMGGIHTTLMPQEALLHADSIVTGFAEDSWPQLLRDFVSGKMKKAYSQKEDFFFSRNNIPQRKGLRTTPYMIADTMELSRGCPRECEFCVLQGTLKGKYYKKPIPEALKEIASLKRKYVLFLDANLIGDKEYAKEFFSKITNLNKWWAGCVTTDVAEDDALVSILAKSGCKGMLLGFESLCQDTLDSIHKKFNRVEQYKNIVKKIHAFGIAVHACFVFGFEKDTHQVFEDTFRFVQEAHIDFPQYTLFTPFPGTPAFARLLSENRILTHDWSLYNGQNCVFQPCHLSADELEQGIRWIQAKTYSLPAVVERIRCSPLFLKPILAITNAHYKKYTSSIPLATRQWKLYRKEVIEENRAMMQSNGYVAHG